MWQNCYHESVSRFTQRVTDCYSIQYRCGVVNLGDAYTEQSFNNDLKAGARVERLDSVASIRSQFPSDFHDSGRLGTFTSLDVSSIGYVNHDGGWAEAERAVSLLMEHVKKRGVKVMPGKAVQELLKDEHGQTKGVRCADGSQYGANVVVLALGSWTASAFPALKLMGKCLATG
jgi:sarcosine oxidase/L-pipecolate oxidase